MANYTGREVLELLKQLEINTDGITSESIGWILDLPETYPLLCWLCRYINENNIETASEIYERETLQKKGVIFLAEDFDKLGNVEDKCSGIAKVNYKTVNKIANNVEKSKQKEKSLEKLTANLLKLDYKIGNELSKLNNEKIKCQVYKDDIVNKCVSQCKEIDMLHKEIQERMKKYSNILSNYHCPIKEKHFLLQMPYDNYKQQDESFRQYLNLWIKKEFDTDYNKISEMSIFEQEFRRIGAAIEDSIVSRIRAECVEKEIEYRLKYIDEYYDMKILESEQRIKLIHLNSQIIALSEEYNRLYESELLPVVEKYTQNLIEKTLLKFATNTLNKSLSTHKKLKCLYLEIKRSLAHNCMLAILYKVEKQITESVMKFLSNTNFSLTKQLQVFIQRDQLMSDIENDYFNYQEKPVEERSELINDVTSFICGNKNNSKACTISNTLAVVQKQRAVINDLERDLISNSLRSCSIFNLMQERIQSIKEFIWTGPTMQPVIIPYAFIENMYKVQFNIENLIDRSDHCMKICKETENMLKENRWLRNKSSLYVWFLTEPKKVISAINQIETFVENQHKIKLKQDTDKNSFL